MTGADTKESDWDSRCKKCGQCCFEKIENERGTIFYTQTSCRFLDLTTRQCKIYERRFAINPSCVKLTPELVQTLRWLPRDCGYQTPVVAPVRPSGKRGKK
ncbi:MAG: YkgJ family cysteine cluster protein [Desulfuromonadaceae bacterium]|nr:YkgJ family cysteine cluster protein [Desulfuromonadaceae bacterium]MDD5106418.1 YkgJ family cysteine cluster protein [Desulfuromonadaceae bacterium]